MIPLIEPIEGQRLAAELDTREPLTRFRGLHVHSLTGDECPDVMHEIGRLRELGFRQVGAGRNLECDLDPLDFGPNGYFQLIAWDPAEQEIVAVYRYQLARRALSSSDRVLRTHQLFEFSGAFNEHIKPFAIELGRSVVNERARRRVIGLFALWIGLRTLLSHHDQTRYYFGNVSLYESMAAPARSLTVAFLETHYPPSQPLLIARSRLRFKPAAGHLAAVSRASGSTPDERIRALRQLLRPHGERVPPILQSYMGLGNTIWFGQTAHDRDFGDALEIGVIVPIETVKTSRAIERFQPQ